MDDDKVIIERKKLEEMEKRLAEFESGCEVIRIEKRSFSGFIPFGVDSPACETIYAGKDAALETIANYANIMKTRMADYREKYNASRDYAELAESLKLRISSATFFDRLKYLFTKEL